MATGYGIRTRPGRDAAPNFLHLHTLKLDMDGSFSTDLLHWILPRIDLDTIRDLTIRIGTGTSFCWALGRAVAQLSSLAPQLVRFSSHFDEVRYPKYLSPDEAPDLESLHGLLAEMVNLEEVGIFLDPTPALLTILASLAHLERIHFVLASHTCEIGVGLPEEMPQLKELKITGGLNSGRYQEDLEVFPRGGSGRWCQV